MAFFARYVPETNGRSLEAIEKELGRYELGVRAGSGGRSARAGTGEHGGRDPAAQALVSPAWAAPASRASRPKPSTGPSAPVPPSPPAAARSAPQASMSAVKS
jgi:hypothetical protein